jgi:hypothetical protein
VRLVALAALALAVLSAPGCAGGDESGATVPLSERLEALCDDARVAVEALGEPKDVGGAVLRPWAAIGARFVADVRRLDGASAAERPRLRSLADDFAGFYDGLRLGHAQWTSGESVAVKMSLQRAYALLARAEATAAGLGAAACARRPFDSA